jgi:hypothetical protein
VGKLDDLSFLSGNEQFSHGGSQRATAMRVLHIWPGLLAFNYKIDFCNICFLVLFLLSLPECGVIDDIASRCYPRPTVKPGQVLNPHRVTSNPVPLTPRGSSPKK